MPERITPSRQRGIALSGPLSLLGADTAGVVCGELPWGRMQAAAADVPAGER
jgi:hypothetical protein